MSGIGGLGMMLMASLGDMLKKDNFVCDCARCDERDTCESLKPLTLEALQEGGIMVRHFLREQSDPKSVEHLYGVHGVAEYMLTGEKFVLLSPADEKDKKYILSVADILVEVNKEEYPGIQQEHKYERCRPEDFKALVFHILGNAHEAMKASFEMEADDGEYRKQ